MIGNAFEQRDILRHRLPGHDAVTVDSVIRVLLGLLAVGALLLALTLCAPLLSGGSALAQTGTYNPETPADPATEARLKESQKLGLTDAVIADAGETPSIKGLSTKGMESVADLVAWVASRSKGLRRIA